MRLQTAEWGWWGHTIPVGGWGRNQESEASVAPELAHMMGMILEDERMVSIPVIDTLCISTEVA